MNELADHRILLVNISLTPLGLNMTAEGSWQNLVKEMADLPELPHSKGGGREDSG